MKLLSGILLFIFMHIAVWWSTNAQFIEGVSRAKALVLSVALALPITLLAFNASRLVYESLEDSAWSARFVGFGVSYLVFPILTWAFLGESMFTAKTLFCIALSCVILCIQVFWT